MAGSKLLADVLQELNTGKKTGALFISVTEASENLVRFYFREGNIYTVSYGPLKDKECLDILDCYSFNKIIYFEGLKSPQASSDLPSTADIISMIRKGGKEVHTD